jgi:allantoinase
MRAAGWEFIGHGMHQKAMNHAETSEAHLIRACLDKIEGFTGQRVRGWLSPGLRETNETPDLLKQAGLDYVCDWVVDDLPSYMTTHHGELVAMPYNLEINHRRNGAAAGLHAGTLRGGKRRQPARVGHRAASAPDRRATPHS